MPLDDKNAHRVSTTDAEAHMMETGDGGLRPTFDGRFATDVGTRIIVGSGITHVGTYEAQAGARTHQIEQNRELSRPVFVDTVQASEVYAGSTTSR